MPDPFPLRRPLTDLEAREFRAIVERLDACPQSPPENPPNAGPGDSPRPHEDLARSQVAVIVLALLASVVVGAVLPEPANYIPPLVALALVAVGCLLWGWHRRSQ